MDSSAPPTPAPTPTTSASTEQATGDGDRLRHIICVRCFPAFEGTREAPQDAVCLCGKRVRAGEQRPQDHAVECAVCNELRGHHNRERHSGTS